MSGSCFFGKPREHTCSSGLLIEVNACHAPLTKCHAGSQPPAPVVPAPPPAPVSRKQIRITGHIRGDPTLPVKRPLPVHVPDSAAELDAAVASSISEGTAATATQPDMATEGSSDVAGEYDEEEEELDSPMMIGNEEASLVGRRPAAGALCCMDMLMQCKGLHMHHTLPCAASRMPAACT